MGRTRRRVGLASGCPVRIVLSGFQAVPFGPCERDQGWATKAIMAAMGGETERSCTVPPW